MVGRDVFTQTAGIHADGDAKGELYATRLSPARFGRRRRYALGKMAGKASVDQNLKTLGIKLPPEKRDLVLRRIVELGDKKHNVTPEDLPLIIADVLKTPARIAGAHRALRVPLRERRPAERVGVAALPRQARDRVRRPATAATTRS